MYDNQKIIALCISKVHDDRFFDFIKALEHSLRQKGYIMLIYQTCSDLYWNTPIEHGEKKIFDLMHFDIIDAVILFEESIYDVDTIQNIKQNAKNSGTPLISIGVPTDFHTNFVFDYEAGFEQVVRHIIEDHNISDIYFIAGKRNEPNSEKRIAIYQKVLAEHSIPFYSDKLGYGDYWSGPTQNIVENIISSGSMPEAIICANDNMAVTTCTVLQEHGYSIPEDIIVTGFDGAQEARYSSPRITTSKCDYDVFSTMIIDALEHLFHDVTYNHSYNLPYTIEIGESCGCNVHTTRLNAGTLLNDERDRFHKYQIVERTLHEVSTQILTCTTPDDFSAQLNNCGFSNICIALNQNCLDASVDPHTPQRKQNFDDIMHVLFQSDSQISNLPAAFFKKDIIPDFPNIIKSGNPLIFTALNFIDIPLGFVCLYPELNKDNYSRIPQYIIAINNYINGYRSMRYQQYMLQQIEESYKQDFLTGLYNRNGFFKELHHLTNLRHWDSSSHILLFSVDLDGLKYINDTFGHAEGDYAIVAVANSLKNVPIEHKIVARFGGDELVLCTITTCPEQDTTDIQTAITDYLDTLNQLSSKPYTVSASIGVSVSELNNFDFEKALKLSDENMYKNKHSKKYKHS